MTTFELLELIVVAGAIAALSPELLLLIRSLLLLADCSLDKLNAKLSV
jgi:hypothetical protein